MPIRINLYHEIQREKLAQQRSPKKIGIAVGSLVLIGLFALYSQAATEAGDAQASLGRRNAELRKVTKLADDAKAQEAKLVEDVKTGETIAEMIEGRTYWAPILEKVAGCVPLTVQLARLTSSVSASSPKRATVNLEGVAVGKDARKTVDDMRVALQTQTGAAFHGAEAVFRNLEDSAAAIRVRSEDQPGVNFTIELTIKVEAEPPPAAPPSTRPSRAKPKPTE
jgi:hypothetical protein